MKKLAEFMKALGAVVYIGALVIFGIAALIGELFPTVIPDWMMVGMCIVYAPIWIWILVTVIREGYKKWKDKKTRKK